MSVLKIVVIALGALLAAWMGFGRVFFGAGGDFVPWYTGILSSIYLVLMACVAVNIARTQRRGHRVHAQTIVALAVSWFGALGFGFTVADGTGSELSSVMAELGGELLTPISVGLSNPLGVLAVGGAIAALLFSAFDARGPRPEEDEDYG